MFLGLQMWRGIASLLVALFHASYTLAMDRNFGTSATQFKNTFSFGGAAGVAFFFVLSGFIISHRHSRDLSQPTAVLDYLWRRFSRVYPPYIIVFFAIIALKAFFPSSGDPIPSDTTTLIKAALLLPQGITVEGGPDAPVVHVAWTLQYEVFFYLIFAAAIINRWALAATITIYALNLAQPIPALSKVPLFSSHFILLFLFGLLTAFLNKKLKTTHAKIQLAVATLAFFSTGYIAENVLTSHTKEQLDITYGIFAAIIIFAIAQARETIDFSKIPPIFGDSSYALYLIHLPIVSILSRITSQHFPHTFLWAGLGLIITVGTSIASGCLFHALIEKPILKKLSAMRWKLA